MKKKLVAILFMVMTICLSAICFTACGPKITDVKILGASSVYVDEFDYSDYQTLPQVRLSVYVDSNSDVRRVDSIEFNSLTTDYKWKIESDELQQVIDTKKQWTGNSNLYMPYKKQRPYI